MSNVRLMLGDCLDVMPTLEANSVDAIVCDPPYGLSFMGKHWDHGVPGVAFWEAALRVAKPGAYLLAFGGTRTFHRLTVAIEDAGWEIRDCLMWLYGSGFPKSHDISKAIDKAAGAEREVVGMKRHARDGDVSHQAWTRNGTSAGDDYATNPKTLGVGMETAPATDAAKQWQGWGTALKPAWEPIVMARKPLTGTVAENVLTWGTGGINVDKTRVMTADQQRDVDACKRLSFLYSDACKQLLSPSLCRDALTYIVSVLRSCCTVHTAPYRNGGGRGDTLPYPAEYVSLCSHLYPSGVWCGLSCYKAQGSLADYQLYRRFCDEHIHPLLEAAQASPALLADALAHICLGQHELEHNRGYNTAHPSIGDDSLSTLCLTFLLDVFINYTTHSSHPQGASIGRWPSNVLLDEDAAALLDEASGPSGGHSAPTKGNANTFGGGWSERSVAFHADTGGASRFFKTIQHDKDDAPSRIIYQAKASKRDRNSDGAVNNIHPTCKPCTLMQYLVRLVTPPNGVILDPFMGSGSTGKGAVLEGFNFIGIELDAEYLTIAEKRISHAQAQPVAQAQPALFEVTA